MKKNRIKYVLFLHFTYRLNGNAVLNKLFWALANAKEMFANKLVTPLFQLN